MTSIFRSRRENTASMDIDHAENSGAATRSSRRALGDITNSTVDGNNTTDDKPDKPQTVTFSVVMNGVERTYMRRDADDIDERDSENPLLCTDVVNQMYDYFSDAEMANKVDSSYMSQQPYINERMRTILVDWLVEVHLKFKMVPETLYLTVHIIDRFLAMKQVRRSKLQLVGVAALLLASKYEEIYPPELRDLVYITDRAYNKQEILEMENQIVTTLDYNLTLPTTHSFLCRFLKAAHADRMMVQMACYLSERSLQEFGMLKYLPSVVAAAAVCVARKSLRRHPWSPTLVKYTKYDEPDLMECLREMEVFADATATQQQAVYRKYSNTKFGAVAKMPLSIL